MEDEIQAGEDGLYCVGFKNVYALDYQSIREAFSQFGRTRTVRGACNGYDSGWTFVRFSNPEEAVRAMTGMRESPHLCDPHFVRYVQDRPAGTYSRRQTEVVKADSTSTGRSPLVRRQDDRSPVRPPTQVEKCEVYIGNLPLGLEKSDVHQLFTKYEIQVVDVRLYKREHKSFAFVVVPTVGDLDLAIKQLNGGKVAGRQIVVTNSRKSSQNGSAAEKPPQVVEAAPPPAAVEAASHVAVETAPPVAGGVRQRLGAGGVAGGGGVAAGSDGVGQGWRGGRPAGPRPVAAAAAAASRMPALMAPGPPPLVMPGLPPPVMSGPPPPLGADRFVPAGSPRQPPGRTAPPRFPSRPTGAGQFQSGDLFDAHGNHFNLNASQFEGAGGQFDGGLSDGGARKAYPGGALTHFEPAGGRAPFPGDQRVRGGGLTAMRRSFDQRGDLDMGYEEPYAKRGRFGGDAADFQLQNGPPPLAGLGRTVTTGPSRPILSQMTPERRSTQAISELIKTRLHAPMEVVVANFQVGTNENDLMGMFAKYEPLNVRIMVNNSSQHPDDFTYAYVTLASRMAADEAVIEMDGVVFQGRPLVVETKKK